MSTYKKLKEQIANKKPITGVTTIVTHPNPHLDEIASDVVIRRYGKKFFPGVENSSIGYITKKMLDEASNNNVAEEDMFYWLLSQGFLAIGIAGGPLDEHGESRTSALKKVMEYLEINKNPELKFLLGYVNYEDGNGDNANHLLMNKTDNELKKAAHQYMLATRIKQTWQMTKDAAEKNKWLHIFMDEIIITIDYQINFIKETESVEKSMEIIELKNAAKAGLFLTVIRHDSISASAITRSILSTQRGQNNVAILQLHSSGQFQLFSNKRQRVRINDVVRSVRVREFQMKNKLIPRWNELESDNLEGSDLYFMSDGQMFFNGSLTQPDVNPLVITDLNKKNPKAKPVFTEEQLIEAIKLGFEVKRFDKKFTSQCSAGKCPAKAKDVSCPLYEIGLKRCFDNRATYNKRTTKSVERKEEEPKIVTLTNTEKKIKKKPTNRPNPKFDFTVKA
jgi:hypothetical protein